MPRPQEGNFLFFRIFSPFMGNLHAERQVKEYMEEKCILCGRPFPTGLHIMGCLICFPCEKRLLHGVTPVLRRRRLCRIYRRAEG